MSIFAKLNAETPEEQTARAARREEELREREAYWKRVEAAIEYLMLLRGALSDWDSQFVESVDRYLRAWGYLTDKQLRVLRRIYRQTVVG